MTKKELASGRNWQKARIVSSLVDTRYLTEYEKELVEQIAGLKSRLLDNWDNNSKSLGLKIQRYDLTVYTITGQFFKHNITYNMVKFYINGLDKNEYKVKKL